MKNMNDKTKLNVLAVGMILIFLLFLAASDIVHASEPVDVLEHCADVEAVAQTIMEKRQEGVSMSIMMRAAGNSELFKTLVVEAFDYPRYTTPSVQRDTVQNFAAKWALLCFQAFEGEF